MALCGAEGNRKLVVETLRSLAELVIWGDQHDARFFDFFAEKHLLSHFNRILRQPANQRGEVPQQVACSRLWTVKATAPTCRPRPSVAELSAVCWDATLPPAPPAGLIGRCAGAVPAATGWLWWAGTRCCRRCPF